MKTAIDWTARPAPWNWIGPQWAERVKAVIAAPLRKPLPMAQEAAAAPPIPKAAPVRREGGITDAEIDRYIAEHGVTKCAPAFAAPSEQGSR